MQLPEFLFIEPQSTLKGAGFILCTSPPFYIAKVWKFKEPPEQAKEILLGKGFRFIQVTGYSIFLTLFFRFDETIMYKPAFTDILLEKMQSYYLTEKIQPNAAAYKKYKIS